MGAGVVLIENTGFQSFFGIGGFEKNNKTHSGFKTLT
jgi:hypothetical protein